MSYFSNYKSVDINLNRFDYEPIRIVLAAYQELKKRSQQILYMLKLINFAEKLLIDLFQEKKRTFKI